ncbi:MAG TPA: hypothetical protein VHF51_09750 [Solirubrobacteraceae bacterium]|nr:hypothetical protein [Solirubrobacteraceae bacterium]
MARFVVEPRGPFALDEARRFLSAFAPAGHEDASRGRHLHLALVPDGSAAPAPACARRTAQW